MFRACAQEHVLEAVSFPIDSKRLAQIIHLEGAKSTNSNEIESVIARAKMRLQKCITVVFECDAHTNAKMVMASYECAMYS